MDIANQILFYASWALLASGAVLCVIGALGIVRFPETYTRMHAAGVIDTGGATLIVVGLMLQSGLTLETVKLAFILFFIYFTSPTASYALARGAWSAGHRPLTHGEADAHGDAAGNTPSGDTNER